MEIHVAAVCTAAEVRMLTGAPSLADMERRLAAYAVGDRWDHEFLHVQALDLNAHPDESLVAINGPSRRFRQSILRDL